MKKMLPILTLVALLPAGILLADDGECHVPADQWQTHEAVMAMAAAQGWTVREFEIDDNCYEIEARDKDGQWFEAKLDPATLEIVKMEHRREKAQSKGSDLAPAGTVTPPANGLFGNGKPPVATSN